jgi:hypothetical protein
MCKEITLQIILEYYMPVEDSRIFQLISAVRGPTLLDGLKLMHKIDLPYSSLKTLFSCCVPPRNYLFF